MENNNEELSAVEIQNAIDKGEFNEHNQENTPVPDMDDDSSEKKQTEPNEEQDSEVEQEAENESSDVPRDEQRLNDLTSLGNEYSITSLIKQRENLINSYHDNEDFVLPYPDDLTIEDLIGKEKISKEKQVDEFGIETEVPTVKRVGGEINPDTNEVYTEEEAKQLLNGVKEANQEYEKDYRQNLTNLVDAQLEGVSQLQKIQKDFPELVEGSEKYNPELDSLFGELSEKFIKEINGVSILDGDAYAVAKTLVDNYRKAINEKENKDDFIAPTGSTVKYNKNTSPEIKDDIDLANRLSKL